jgi:hypothetical protein
MRPKGVSEPGGWAIENDISKSDTQLEPPAFCTPSDLVSEAGLIIRKRGCSLSRSNPIGTSRCLSGPGCMGLGAGGQLVRNKVHTLQSKMPQVSSEEAEGK